jgi:hypothetical protein
VAVVIQSFEVEPGASIPEAEGVPAPVAPEAPSPPLEREVERLLREADARSARLRAT